MTGGVILEASGTLSVSGAQPPACLPVGLARDVARGDDHGKYELVGAVFVRECLQVTDGNGDLFAGENVGHGLREDIRAFLVEQAATCPVCLACS